MANDKEYVHPMNMDEIEIWKRKVQDAPDEELMAIHEAQFLGFQGVEDQRWQPYIGIIEEELKQRGLGR